MGEGSEGGPPRASGGGRWIARLRVIAWIAVLLAVAAGLFSVAWERLLFAPVEGFAYHEPDRRYEELFPYYVELCASSQYRSEKLGSGGSPGHAVMYLKGACRDREAHFPKLRRCVGHSTDPSDPEHGAGISVNRWFRNVNWVAFDGRGQFFDGEVRPGEVVTPARLEAVARKAVAAGIYRGIEVWPYPGQQPGSDQLDFVKRESVGTDFALRYARSALCGRVPVEPAMLDEIIHFLNDLNREFATGAADYQWNGYHDNCLHTLSNALAAASIGEPIAVWATKLRQLFHLAVPANAAIDLATKATDGPVDSYPTIWANDPMRNAMLEFGWLPTRHGAVLVSLPVHPKNEVFDPEPRLLVFQGPVTLRTTRRLLAMLDDPRFTELGPNLEHFEGIYREILTDRERDDTSSWLRGDRYRRMRRRYFSVIEKALGEVERMQRELSPRPGAARPSEARSGGTGSLAPTPSAARRRSPEPRSA